MESSVFEKSLIFNDLLLLLQKGGKIRGDLPCEALVLEGNWG